MVFLSNADDERDNSSGMASQSGSIGFRTILFEREAVQYSQYAVFNRHRNKGA